MIESTIPSGHLVATSTGAMGVVVGYEDPELTRATILFFDGAGNARETSGDIADINPHSWNSLFQDFMRLASQAGREPETFRGVHEDIQLVVDMAGD